VLFSFLCPSIKRYFRGRLAHIIKKFNSYHYSPSTCCQAKSSMDPVDLFISHALTNDDIAGVRTSSRNYCEQDIQVVTHGLITSDLHFYLPSKVCEIIFALLQNEIQPFFKCIAATHTIESGKVGTERRTSTRDGCRNGTGKSGKNRQDE